ncbi:MAG: ribose 5-phosphate isomerase B [Rhodospirillales bacterium]|nr:ribose 5-phosphate isomerase B [Rhodospirillales bacterium]MCW8862905.1 ribose 5-phosphate isomerase B [Rhodospirillales bacterium]MCW8971496.1 ribose 5-phosphate isomerase B [Rhodospirillales bacterium]
MTSKAIAIACDHGGYDMKVELIADLQSMGLEVLDLGPDGRDSVDYPDYAYALADAIRSGKADRGILICGSGIGISIAANRYTEIRAALVHDALGARLCREHNDANVIVFGGRMTGIEVARDCLKIFLNTDFEGGRHARRVAKLSTPS